MSEKEADRNEILCRVQCKELKLTVAARHMRVGNSQAKRIWQEFKKMKM